MKINKLSAKERRHHRIKAKISGTAKRPRLVVFRSISFNHVQLVNDEKGIVICGTSDLKIKKGSKLERAKAVGLEIAKIAKEKGIDKIVFDRGGYRYHGRVKAIADGAREGGLQF